MDKRGTARDAPPPRAGKGSRRPGLPDLSQNCVTSEGKRAFNNRTVQRKPANANRTNLSRSSILFNKACVGVRALEEPLHYSQVAHSVEHFTTRPPWF